MKFRHERTEPSESEERELEALIRGMAPPDAGDRPAGPPAAYWQNLTVRTNERIDRETSGRALSIHWALRVAVPGVLAILSFFIGLHYYAPERPETEETVAAVILSLPGQTVDSLLVNPPLAASIRIEDVSTDLFGVSQDQIGDYLINRGETQTLVESLSDQQLGDMLLAMGNVEH